MHQYVIRKRLEACVSAMSAGIPATRCCEQYAFKNYSGFYRAFKKEYGCSPSEYIEARRLQPEK